MEKRAGARTRPTAVTIAVALWWVAIAVHLVVAVVGVTEVGRDTGGAVVGLVAGLVVISAWSALFVWLAARMARGSGTARLWLAIVGGLTACGTLLTITTDGPNWGLVDGMCIVAATVLSYLPSARPFFPRGERRGRAAEPRTIGWDPTTGERIVEQPAPDAPTR